MSISNDVCHFILFLKVSGRPIKRLVAVGAVFTEYAFDLT
jgi:hypothetical protein